MPGAIDIPEIEITPTGREQIGTIIAAPGIQRLTDQERWALFALLEERGKNPDAVATVISTESGFRPDIQNMGGAPYSGLIQLSHKTIEKKHGITPEQYRNKSAYWQIVRDVVSWPWPGDNDPGSYHMSLFLPAFADKPDGFELGVKGSKESLGYGLTKGAVYKGNYGFDTDKDGTFTVGDVRQFTRDRYNQYNKKPRIPVYDWSDAPPPPERNSASAGTAVIGLGLFIGAMAAIAMIASKKS